MGFFESFLGLGAAHVVHDMQQDKKDTQKWNDLFSEIGDYETKFCDFLKSIGCPDTYVFDVEVVNNGNIMPEKRKMDNYRTKINEYLSLGGKGEYIFDLTNIDQYIEKIKFLQKNNCIDRQEEFCMQTLNEIIDTLDCENQIKNESISSLPDKENKETKRNDVDLTKGIAFSGVRVWNADEQKFYDFNVDLSCDDKKIVLYFENTMEEVANSPLQDDVYMNLSISDLDDPNKKIIRLGDTTFVMDTYDAMALKEYYDAYDNRMDDILHKKQERIVTLYEKIDGIDEMAMNFLSMIDENIMLNHDKVIMMQKLWSYNKIREIEMYDADATMNEDFLMDIAVVKQGIDGMVEIIQESDSIDTEECSFACWEAIKRQSVQFYADMWGRKYEKYVNEPLPYSQSKEADGTLDRYIENVIKCNEIDNTDNEVLGIFTYYMIEKGYAPGTLYFPAYLDIVMQAFDVIGNNMKKTDMKEKLKGGFQKECNVIHYTIDDVDMMNGNEFENFVCDLYSKMGYKSEVTKQSCDQGLDVIAEKNNIRIGIQAKCYSNTVGNSAIQEAVAGKEYYKCDKVAVVTNNAFTSSAIELAKANDVILWNRDMLKEKIKELM